MIPEPQQTYLLEFLAALGPAAKDFVIAGAQAIKFTLPEARGTKDFDFLLDVIPLRGSHTPLVKPETVIAWHRKGFRLYWTWKSRRCEGRPSVPPEIRNLIRK